MLADQRPNVVTADDATCRSSDVSRTSVIRAEIEAAAVYDETG
jgi:hypothetical protein